MHGATAMFQVIKLSDLACIIEHLTAIHLKLKNMEIIYCLRKLLIS